MAFNGRYHYRNTPFRDTDHASAGLTTDWPLRREAKFFLNMILAGRISLEQAKADILMTDVQMRYLIRHRMAEPIQVLEIKQHRWQTWEELLNIYRQATGRAVAA